MKTVFFVSKDHYSEAKNMLYADDLVARQSITVRDNTALGMKHEGYYIQIEGEDHAVKKAKELMGDKAKELHGKEAHDVMKAIEEQESSAAAGFGSIFG
jgi:thiamine monophosphate synthase